MLLSEMPGCTVSASREPSASSTTPGWLALRSQCHSTCTSTSAGVGDTPSCVMNSVPFSCSASVHGYANEAFSTSATPCTAPLTTPASPISASMRPRAAKSVRLDVWFTCRLMLALAPSMAALAAMLPLSEAFTNGCTLAPLALYA